MKVPSRQRGGEGQGGDNAPRRGEIIPPRGVKGQTGRPLWQGTLPGARDPPRLFSRATASPFAAVGALTAKERNEEKYAELEVRSLTGAGAH